VTATVASRGDDGPTDVQEGIAEVHSWCRQCYFELVDLAGSFGTTSCSDLDRFTV